MTNPDDRRIDHSGIGVAGVPVSARFYDAVLGALGLRPLFRISAAKGPFCDGDDFGGGGYGISFPIFRIDCFHPAGVRQHIAFRARSRDEVDAFHAAALAAGGRDNGPPACVKAAIRRAIMRPSHSIPTATISRQCFVRSE